ncbi:uncharacterized protein PG998_008574 [Apiospora kogelbergensis]|uniref:uncharacterized protein n=1 Tax=Apiospora kogelbergensis TaxID=1337665 RepID=UPI00312D4630
MSSHDPGKTDGGAGGNSSFKPASVKPGTNEVMDRLLEFSRKHPELNVTTDGFATALRKAAMRKQVAELMKPMVGAPVGITSPQLHDDNNTMNVKPSTARPSPAPILTSTPGPAPVLTAISGFAAASSVSGTRKAAPPSLNLVRPVPKPTPNHYLSLPDPGKEMLPDTKKIEQLLNWRDPLAEPVVLLKSPIAMLVPDGKDEEQTGSPCFNGDFSIEQIPEANQKITDLSTDFTLETPLTATFAKEQIERKRAGKDKNPDDASVYQVHIESLFKEKLHSSASKDDSDSNRVSKRIDLIDWLTSKPELIIQVGKHLPPDDLLNLYSVHRSFNEFISNFLRSSIVTWTDYNCPEAALVFNWRSLDWRHLTISDPGKRPQESPLTPTGFHPWRPTKSTYRPKAAGGDDTSSRKGKEKMVYDDDAKEDPVVIRLVPTIKWYIMCLKRQQAVDDILAHLARRATPTNELRRSLIRGDARSSANINCQCYILEAKAALKAGKPLPPLKKLKLLSEIGMAGLPEEILAFTDHDLLRMQCFFLKLELRFNDPIYGPEDQDLSYLMLGQRSLFPLRQLLFGEKYHTMDEMMALKVRFDLGCSWTMFEPAAPQVLLHQNWKVLGLVAEESVRRGLNLHQHMLPLMMWGFVDWKTGRNLCPTEQEIYIPDGDHKTRHIDTSEEFTRIEILKGRWDSLTKPESEEVLKAQLARDDILRKWDNNQLCDPLKQTVEKDHLVQLSYAITSTFTGVTQPPTIPKIDDHIGPIDADDSVETPGPITAKLLELERRFHNNELGSDDDGDSDSELGVHSDTEDNDDGMKVEGENTWTPNDPGDDLQLPRSFTQDLEEYKKRLHRAAASLPNNIDVFFPANITPTRAIHCQYSRILEDQQAQLAERAQQAQQAQHGGPGDHPIVDQAYIDRSLNDMEEELEDGEVVEELETHDPWHDFQWLDAAHSVWEFLYMAPDSEPGSDQDEQPNDDDADGDDDSDDGGNDLPDEFGVMPQSTYSMHCRSWPGVPDFEFDYSGVDVEETVEAAWADLQDAEEDAVAAGHRNIQARD